ncbi:MAG: adenosylmethionine--8-amino-7-oxononanoate transaminase [Aeromicrobium sp.]|nr:adenosylmethionine--8-amino-7-oxononanoate transaminase [Burkholderiales bacterium]
MSVPTQSPPNTNADLMERSLASVWHPCTQMKHHPQFPLVPIASGSGVWLTDAEGKRYVDAVSSWWVNLFGHCNPRINAAIKEQLDTLEHAMLAGFTHAPAVLLAERLGKLIGLGHAFFASDGASAVEIALKMSFHYWRNLGVGGKTKFVSLDGSYHGETLGALSVTDVAVFRDAYAPLLNNNLAVPFPTRDQKGNTDSACCPECADVAADVLESLLRERHAEIAAFIVEPLVQGAAGMRMYHPQYLRRARELCTQYHVHLIADEIMTGFGRTGTMFAWEQVSTSPKMRADFMCLSKGITGGYLPLSCVLTTDAVYQAFYDDSTARGFLHSHSYTGSALACRAALATLDIFDSDNVIVANRDKAARFGELMNPLRQHPRVSNYRQLGMIWAFDINAAPPDFAKRMFAAGLARGVLVRPIGNTIYFMPPYVIDDATFVMLVAATLAAIDEVLS